MLALTVDNSRKKVTRFVCVLSRYIVSSSSSALLIPLRICVRVLNVFTLSRVTQRTLILLSILLCVLWSLTHKWIRTQEIVEIRACFSFLIFPSSSSSFHTFQSNLFPSKPNCCIFGNRMEILYLN